LMFRPQCPYNYTAPLKKEGLERFAAKIPAIRGATSILPKLTAPAFDA
jgi:hypothetical protein